MEFSIHEQPFDVNKNYLFITTKNNNRTVEVVEKIALNYAFSGEAVYLSHDLIFENMDKISNIYTTRNTNLNPIEFIQYLIKDVTFDNSKILTDENVKALEEVKNSTLILNYNTIKNELYCEDILHYLSIGRVYNISIILIVDNFAALTTNKNLLSFLKMNTNLFILESDNINLLATFYELPTETINALKSNKSLFVNNY